MVTGHPTQVRGHPRWAFTSWEVRVHLCDRSHRWEVTRW